MGSRRPDPQTDGPVNKSRHYVLDILLSLFRDHSAMNKLIKADTVF